MVSACLLVLNACGADEATAPSAPGGGNGGGGSPPEGRDAGPMTDNSDDDAGTLTEAELACSNVDAVPFVGEDTPPGGFLNATEAPADFVVTRVSIGFDGDCSSPSVIMAMGGGRCPDGNGHELVFVVDADAVEAGRLVGQYVVGGSDEPDAISIQYQRPERVRPSGQYGTCGAASGTIDFASMPGPGLERGDAYNGMYNLSLPPCDGAEGTPSQILRGTFALELEQGLDAICPTE